MIEEANAAADDDKRQRERVESRNALENYVYQIRNTINDESKLGDKIDADDKATIEETVKDAIDWLDSNQHSEKEDFDEKFKEVEKVVQPIFSKLYGSGGAPGGGGYGGGYDENIPDHDEL